MFDDIKETIWQHVVAEATKQSPMEACGLIIRSGKGGQRAITCKNEALREGSDPRKTFRITREEMEQAEDQGEILACYHSHIYQPPIPSAGDKTFSEQSRIPFLIVGWPTKQWELYTPNGWRAELVGRPYFYGILDCYTLIRDYYKEKLNIELADFDRADRWWADGRDFYMENYWKVGFVQVQDAPRLHDVILMQMWPSKVANHAAIYLGDGHILHHLTGRPSVITTYLVNDGEYAKATRGIFRHKTLC